MRNKLLTLNYVVTLTENNIQSAYQDIEESPIVIKNFVGCHNDIKEILFNKMDVRVRTNNDILVDIDKEKILGIPLALPRDKLIPFLAKHSWIQMFKTNKEDYSVEAKTRGFGGMYS